MGYLTTHLGKLQCDPGLTQQLCGCLQEVCKQQAIQREQKLHGLKTAEMGGQPLPVAQVGMGDLVKVEAVRELYGQGKKILRGIRQERDARLGRQ